MTDREKLVVLIDEVAEGTIFVSVGEQHVSINSDDIADHLLANGVAVQNWRDAKSDPPPQDEDVLLRFCNGTMVVGGLREDGGWYSNTDAEWYTDCDTIPEKWMSLSEVTKEETK